MRFKASIYACISVALLSVIAWVATGAKNVTHWECEVTTCAEDKHCYKDNKPTPDDEERFCKDGKCHSDFGVDTDFKLKRWETCYEFGLTPNNYVDGVLQGKGVYYLSSGEIIECNYVDNLKQGKCITYGTDGSINNNIFV